MRLTLQVGSRCIDGCGVASRPRAAKSVSVLCLAKKYSGIVMVGLAQMHHKDASKLTQ